jgi:hypothetical protein
MSCISNLGGMKVELMVPERVVERKGILWAGESLDCGERVPMVWADVCGTAGHVCDLLQRLFLFVCLEFIGGGMSETAWTCGGRESVFLLSHLGYYPVFCAIL